MLPSPDPSRRPLAVAHRGWHQVHLENTMEAFRAAYAAGCDMVEFDVQLSRDGIPFIFHDDDGVRLAGRKEAVSDLDWKDLEKWVLPPSEGGQASGYRLPTLEQFLEEFGNRPFYLELKVPKAKENDRAFWEALGEKSASLVKSCSPHPETFLASFHPPILSHLGPITPIAHQGLKGQAAYPHLVGIFENLGRFLQALDSGVPALERYSLSWEVYQGYLAAKTDSDASLSRPIRPQADKLLLWDIHGEADMEAARIAGIYALVADDVPTMLRVCSRS